MKKGGQGVYSDFKCKTKRRNKFSPQHHQEFVKEYFKKTPYKGLLLYHRLGSGKTCSSIITADLLLEMKQVSTVYVFTPGSLRANWINEYCDTCGQDPKILIKKYKFITINYDVEEHLPTDLNDSLVIIDEVHNLINGYLNQAKNAVAIYKLIDGSNCKVLALTGTPVFSKILEWFVLGNLLKPNTFPSVVSDRKINYNVIRDFFVMDNEEKPLIVDGKLRPKNPEKFYDMSKGIISYVKSSGKEGDYPEKIVHDPIIVSMTEEQTKAYDAAIDSENLILKSGYPEFPRVVNPRTLAKYKLDVQMYIMSKQRIRSRKESNFLYPDVPEMYSEPMTIEELEKKFKKPRDKLVDIIRDNKVITGQDGEIRVSLIKPDLLEPEGWISRKYFENGNLKNYSPKMVALFNNILSNFGGKHVVYTFFKTHSGVNIMRSLFEMCGLRTECYSGDLSDNQRTKLLKEFNSKQNRDGDKIKVLFVTDAGKEGITILEVRHLHIFESDERGNKIKQIEGRVVRYKSHIHMPPEDQNVHIWKYWAMPSFYVPIPTWMKNTPQDIQTIYDRGSIDEIFYHKGLSQIAILEGFENLLMSYSIENDAGIAPEIEKALPEPVEEPVIEETEQMRKIRELKEKMAAIREKHKK